MPRTTAPSWTEEEDEWLRQDYPLYSNAELAAFKALDGWPRDEQAIARRARTLGIRKDPSRGYRKPQRHDVWTDEMQAWARGYIPGHSWREISDECARLFGKPLTKTMVNNLKRLVGVKSGTHGGRFRPGLVPFNKGKTWDDLNMPEESRARCRSTQFRKGNQPWNTGELLDERLMHYGGDNEHGTWEVHVGLARTRKANDQWIPRAWFNWMQANGREWPEGCKAIHIDGDCLNDDADNIVPVPTDIWPLVMGAVKHQLEWHDRETLEVAIAYAKVTRARNDVERKMRLARGGRRKDDLEWAKRMNDA